MSARSARRWTTSDVRALMDASRAWPRYELIGGELIVTPAPGSLHQAAVFALARLLDDYCDRERIGVTFMSPADLDLVPGTISQPDVFVVPFSVFPAGGERLEWEMVTSLLLAVETISPSSARTDRVEKRDHYLGARVEEYWVMDADARMIERWLQDRETPMIVRDRLVWHPEPARSALEIDLVEFFLRVTGKLRLPR